MENGCAVVENTSPRRGKLIVVYTDEACASGKKKLASLRRAR